MSDYSKMKNADLEALLKARNLPHTGKKADLVARLTEDDTQKASKAIPEDEIDWDDDDLPAPAKPAPATTATPAASAPAKKEEAKAQPAAAKAAPAPKADAPATTAKTNGSATEPAAAAAPAEEATTAEPAPSFIAGLNSTSVDDEIEKRRKRIERFRNPNDAASNELADEELRKLARMEKFKDLSIAEKMDAALPERQKRKRDNADEGARGADKHSGDRRSGRGARGGDRVEKKDAAKQGAWMSEADRKAAEARKARFSAA